MKNVCVCVAWWSRGRADGCLKKGVEPIRVYWFSIKFKYILKSVNLRGMIPYVTFHTAKHTYSHQPAIHWTNIEELFMISRLLLFNYLCRVTYFRKKYINTWNSMLVPDVPVLLSWGYIENDLLIFSFLRETVKII